jgi:Tol biopolymer transport system component
MKLRRPIQFLVCLLAASLCSCVPAYGQAVVFRITEALPWRAANGDSDSSWYPERNEMATSANGNWVVFESGANNLIHHDANRYGDIFVFEAATGRILGITSNASFTANSSSYDPSISGDGRYVVFASNASNLVSGDNNNMSDVFLVNRDPDGNGIFDEQPYTFERISVDLNGYESHGFCMSPCVSDDGSRILFLSDAPDLVANDYNGTNDAFLWDLWWGTMERVDVDSNGDEANNGCSFADLSADGNVVAFCSYSDNLAPFDTNSLPDVFVRDLYSGTTELVSTDPYGVPGDLQSYVFRHCLSFDGRFVAFQSFADDLTIDTNFQSDIFIRDRWNRTTALVSVASNGVQGNGGSWNPTLSAYGSRLTFVSTSDNLVSGDGNANGDIFLRDLNSGTTTLVSASANGGSSNGWSGNATVSADGSMVALSSDASDLVNMGDTAGHRDVFLADLAAGTTRYVSAIPAGEANGPSMSTSNDSDAPTRPVLSKDGRYVAFESDATNLIESDGNGAQDVFVADRTTGAMVRVSVSSSGVEGNGKSWGPTISGTGRFVAFASVATNLVASDANGDKSDVFVHDRDPDANGVFDEGNGTTTLASVDSSGIQGNDGSDFPAITPDGTKIAYTYNFHNCIHDLVSGQTHGDGFGGATDIESRPSITADGTRVYFQNRYVSLGGLYVSEVVEYSYGGPFGVLYAGGLGPDNYANCASPSVSSDGTRVAYSIGDASVDSFRIGVFDSEWTPYWGNPLVGCETSTFQGFAAPAMNGTGHTLTFYVRSSLSTDDTNTALDVYLLDIKQDASGLVTGFSDPMLVSKGTAGVGGNADSVVSSPSEDGNLIAFASDASDLVLGDTNGVRDIFLYDRTSVARWLNYGSGFAGPHKIPDFASDLPPVLGTTITLSLGNSSQIPVNALVYISARGADVALNWGARLLVDLSVATSVIIPLGASGGSFQGTVPSDPALIGVSAYLQALERDDAVPHKLSFTPGLELHLGN